ncbi:MAG: hypothetical protein ACOYVJ_01820 [Nitrospirota bacterium]
MRKIFTVITGLFLIWAVTGCQRPSTETLELKSYPLDSMEGVVMQSGAEIDETISSDGKGSLKIVAREPVVVRLFETGDLDVENARVTYQAKVRTEGLEGQAFLEMLCSFTGKGEFFSRGLQSPLSGTMEWTTVETPFFLQKGQNPENIKLNLVVNGRGTVWIDGIRLIKGPLQ